MRAAPAMGRIAAVAAAAPDAQADPDGERERAFVVILLALAGVIWVFMLTASSPADGRYFIAGDGHYLYMTARSLAFDGDLNLSNQYLVWGDRWGLGRSPSADGWVLPPREIGPALLMVPGLWLHQVLDLAEASAPKFAATLPALTPAACVCLLARLWPGRQGLLASTIGVLAFVLPFYAWGRSAYPHAGDALATTLLFYALMQTRTKAWPVGLALALCLSMRLQNALWLAWPLTIWLGQARLKGDRAPTAHARELATMAGLGALGLSPILFLSAMHPGSEAGLVRWGLEFFNFDEFGGDLVRVLFGVHGLVSWTPIVALACLGLVFGGGEVKNETRAQERAALVVCALLWVLMASVRDVAGGDAFGARRLCGLTPLVAWGTLGVLKRAKNAGVLAYGSTVAACLACAGFNLVRVWSAIAGSLDLRA